MAGRNVDVIDLADDRHRAIDRNILGENRAALHEGALRTRLGANLVDDLPARFQIFVIFEGELFVSSLSGGYRIKILEILEIETLDRERLRTNARDLLVDIL